MAQPRLDLHEILKDVLGSKHVYFQPPEDLQLIYPCIVYNRDFVDEKSADNIKYIHKRRYQVTVIGRNPDSDILEKMEALPLCTYQRFFAVEHLNHDVYNLFF